MSSFYSFAIFISTEYCYISNISILLISIFESKSSCLCREGFSVTESIPARDKPLSPVAVAATNEAPDLVNPIDKVPASVAPINEAAAAVAPVAAPPAAVAAAIAAPIKTQPAAVPATHNPTKVTTATRSPGPSAQVAPANQIKTVAGDIYSNAYVEKVEPDGIIISYALSNGGMAMTKLVFVELPADLRQRYEPKPRDGGP